MKKHEHISPVMNDMDLPLCSKSSCKWHYYTSKGTYECRIMGSVMYACRPAIQNRLLEQNGLRMQLADQVDHFSLAKPL